MLAQLGELNLGTAARAVGVNDAVELVVFLALAACAVNLKPVFMNMTVIDFHDDDIAKAPFHLLRAAGFSYRHGENAELRKRLHFNRLECLAIYQVLRA